MICKNINEIPKTSCLHIAAGAFDGMHCAHKKIIMNAVENAKKNKEQSLIYTFAPLPKEFFLKQDFHGRLLPTQIKQEMLEECGADNIIISNFEEIKDYSEKEFIDLLLTKAENIILYSGEDFRIGCINGESYTGNRITKVQEKEIYIDGEICRSTRIRELIAKGELELVNKLLGWEYRLYSETTPGDKIGRQINFPTINIKIPHQLIPKAGVYFGEIIIFNKIYPAAIYIGDRPTVHGKTLRIESHVITEFPYPELDSNTPAEVILVKKIFEEKRFSSLENLKEMLYNYKKVSLGLATERYKNKQNRLF